MVMLDLPAETQRRRTPPGAEPEALRLRCTPPPVTSGPPRDLIAQGFQATEAANLTGFLIGLAPVERGWTVGEIERLLFVRHLVERRYIKS